MDLDTIEYHWQNVLRTYKKNNKLLRCYIKKPKYFNSVDLLQIYDEEENKLSLDDFNNIFKKKDNNSNIISILEISELKFTTQSFIIEFNLRQVMVLKNKPIFNKCLINISSTNQEQNKNKKLEIKFNNTDISNTSPEIDTDESDDDTDTDNNNVIPKENTEIETKIKAQTEQLEKDISNVVQETNTNDNSILDVSDNVLLEIVETL